MNIITLPDANVSLSAGKSNENTVPIRVTLFQHPGFKSNPVFYGAPYQFDDDEKQILKKALKEKFEKKFGVSGMLQCEEIIDEVIESLPPIHITMMNGWSPVVVSLDEPKQLGYKRVSLEPRPRDN